MTFKLRKSSVIFFSLHLTVILMFYNEHMLFLYTEKENFSKL